MTHELKQKAGIPTLKEQYALKDKWLEYRLKYVMPALLKECGIDLWVVICGEYNEDPVFRTIVPSLMFSASRTTCFMFAINEEGEYEALNFNYPAPSLLKYYTQGFDPRTEKQMDAIRRTLSAYKGKRIAVNVSSACGQTDGLSQRLYEILSAADTNLLTDTDIAVRWLETRIDDELELYPAIYRIAMDIQKEAYTRNVITPGVTTTTDVEWFILERINDLGLSAWFSPDVDLQREGCADTRLSGAVIEEGDLLHTDMGITCFGLNTDSQRLAYVCRPGESSVPESIQSGFKRANRFQDIVREQMIEGRSGNTIFAESILQAKKEGLRPMLYTHPIGYYGHGAGPIFGLYTNQNPIPIRGDFRLHDRTCYALELNVTESVSDWNNQDVVFYIEETIFFKDGKAEFMDPEGRTRITLI